MSKVRMSRSTPAVAMVLGRYLFQSCVRASEGGEAGVWVTAADLLKGGGGGVWMGMARVRWLEAEGGVRRSKMRRCESDETEERIEGECGEKEALYVQECVGSVRRESVRSGDHCVAVSGVSFGFGFSAPERMGEREGGLTILMVPSHELEQIVSFDTRFQWTEKTSRLCSCQERTGKLSRPMSNSLMEPSPEATMAWFSCASDQEMSKRESCVSNLRAKE